MSKSCVAMLLFASLNKKNEHILSSDCRYLFFFDFLSILLSPYYFGTGVLYSKNFPFQFVHGTVPYVKNIRTRINGNFYSIGKHVKGADKMEDLKKFFIYLMERLER
jgi:hypothetical protein